MAGDGFTAVHFTTDPVEGEMLVEALRGEAIDARLVKVNSALLGAGPQLFQSRIEVATESAARARELLDELGHPDAIEALSEAPESEPEGGAADALPALRPIKVGAGLILPGAGHYYARHPWTAITLEAGLLACVAVLWFGLGKDHVSNLMYATVFAIFVVDVGGALLAVRALNRGGAPAPDDRQLLRGLVLLAMAGLAGGVVTMLVALPGWLRARDLATLVATCTDRDITIRNRGARDRYVSLDEAGITSRSLPPGRAYPAHVDETSDIRLAAGSTIVRTFRPTAEDVGRCQGSGLPNARDCAVQFQLSLQEVDAKHPRLYRARGLCAPEWYGAHMPVPAMLSPIEEEP